jgi:iron complex outermembrane recepter protein
LQGGSHASFVLAFSGGYNSELSDSPSLRGQAQTAAPEVAETGLAEITVTAQRREEDQERVPVSVTVLTQAMLQAKSIQTESDLQAAVPGLTAQSASFNNSLVFSIRGQTLDGNCMELDYKF